GATAERVPRLCCMTRPPPSSLFPPPVLVRDRIEPPRSRGAFGGVFHRGSWPLPIHVTRPNILPKPPVRGNSPAAAAAPPGPLEWRPSISPGSLALSPSNRPTGKRKDRGDAPVGSSCRRRVTTRKGARACQG